MDGNQVTVVLYTYVCLPLPPPPPPPSCPMASLPVAQVSSFDSPLLRSACARLANAAVAVLGPEFTLGSAAYSQVCCAS